MRKVLALAAPDGAKCCLCTVLCMLRLAWFRLLGFQARAGKALPQLPPVSSIFQVEVVGLLD